MANGFPHAKLHELVGELLNEEGTSDVSQVDS